MADIVTGTVSGQVDVSTLMSQQADIRREQAIDAGVLTGQIKDASWEGINKTSISTDRVTDQSTAYFIAGQATNFQNATALAALTASTNANFNQTLAAIQLAATQTTAAAQLAASQNAAATAAAAAATQALVVSDGNATRALINSQTIDALRFANLKHECCDHRRGHREEGTFSFGPPTGAVYPA